LQLGNQPPDGGKTLLAKVNQKSAEESGTRNTLALCISATSAKGGRWRAPKQNGGPEVYNTRTAYIREWSKTDYHKVSWDA